MALDWLFSFFDPFEFLYFFPSKYRSYFFIGGPRVAGQFLLCFSSLPTVGPSKQHAITIMISTHFKNDNHTLRLRDGKKKSVRREERYFRVKYYKEDFFFVLHDEFDIHLETLTRYMIFQAEKYSLWPKMSKYEFGISCRSNYEQFFERPIVSKP